MGDRSFPIFSRIVNTIEDQTVSDNPFQVPNQPRSDTPHLPPVVDVINKVSPPAIGLMVTGGINLLFSLWGVVSAVLVILGMNPLVDMQNEDFERNRQQLDPAMGQVMDQIQMWSKLMSGPLGLVMNVVTLLIAIGIIYAGIQMKSLRSYSMVMTFSILAMVPCLSNCCWVGLPIGIWALVVLNDPAVKAGFGQR